MASKKNSLKLSALSQGFLLGSVLLTSLYFSRVIVQPVEATISSYTASAFAQYCNDHPDTCVRVVFTGLVGSVTCPNGLVPQTIYVHAGDGQTVYELPHEGFTFVIDGSTVTVTVTTHPHNLSWIGVMCAQGTSSSPSTSPSGSASASPSTSPSTSPSVSPSTSPEGSASPAASPSDNPGESVTPSASPSVSPSVAPSVSPSPANSATPAPSNDNNNNDNNDNKTSDNASEGQILGAYADTGVVQDAIMNVVGSIGGLMTSIGAVLYGQKKNKKK